MLLQTNSKDVYFEKKAINELMKFLKIHQVAAICIQLPNSQFRWITGNYFQFSCCFCHPVIFSNLDLEDVCLVYLHVGGVETQRPVVRVNLTRTLAEAAAIVWRVGTKFCGCVWHRKYVGIGESFVASSTPPGKVIEQL